MYDTYIFAKKEYIILQVTRTVITASRFINTFDHCQTV